MSPSRLRILLTIDAVGGVWQYGLDLARELVGRGHEPVLALLGPEPDASQRAEAHAIKGARLIETGLPLDWLCDGPAPVIHAGEAIAGMARQLAIDVVQLNMPTLAAAQVYPVPTIAVTHGCVSTWWDAARSPEPLAASFHWHRQLMSEGLRAADRVVAPTASYAGMIASHYGLRHPPHVVHNGRNPLGPSHAEPIHDRVLTVGRLWDDVKRTALLDRVAGRLTIPFDAAGAVTGPHGESVALTHLNHLGHVDTAALGRRLAARPVFVSAASFEPFGLAVLEAAGAGCALVLSDIESFRELWNGVALFVSGDDDAAYARAIETLIGDAALRLQLGTAARERASRYTPQATADQMIALYADVLRHHEAAGKVAA